MKDFNIYAVGGTAIKIANRYLEEGVNHRFLNKLVGFDSSTADKELEGAYPIERLEGANGSGGDRTAFADQWGPFSKAMVAKYPPAKVNIVVFSTGGGTGASLGPWMVRQMLLKKIPVVAIVVGDTSSLKEQENTIATLGSLYNQIKTGSPVVFSFLENTLKNTHGEVNADAVARIDNTMMIFNSENKSIDDADIKHFFYYTDVVNADPIMTQLTFLADNQLETYNRKPIAAISLFVKPDDVRAPFPDMLYRKGGVFGDSFTNIGTGVHAVLDHGDTLRGLQEMITAQQTRTDEMAVQFRNKEANPFGGSASDDGMM